MIVIGPIATNTSMDDICTARSTPPFGVKRGTSSFLVEGLRVGAMANKSSAAEHDAHTAMAIVDTIVVSNLSRCQPAPVVSV
jgi:hypothetical protein